MKMKTPFRPVSPRPSPPRSRAQAPVTPALTLSQHLSALDLRTYHIFDLVPLPSMATAKQMMRKRRMENSTLPAIPERIRAAVVFLGSQSVSSAAPFGHRQGPSFLPLLLRAGLPHAPTCTSAGAVGLATGVSLSSAWASPQRPKQDVPAPWWGPLEVEGACRAELVLPSGSC